MDLVLITNQPSIQNEHVLLVQFFELGLETLHVRKPNLTFGQLKEWIRKLPSRFHGRIMLHSHHDLCLEFQIKGLHFPDDLRLDAREYGKVSLRRSTSRHQVQDVVTSDTSFEYAYLSPVFDSISKVAYKAYFSETGLKNILPA